MVTAFLFSAKLYERFKLHMEIAKLARNKLDSTLQELRRQAECTIKKKYPVLFWLPLHLLWNWFFVLIALSGAITTGYILRHYLCWPLLFAGKYIAQRLIQN